MLLYYMQVQFKCNIIPCTGKILRNNKILSYIITHRLEYARNIIQHNAQKQG